jgi:hypothetical protein
VSGTDMRFVVRSRHQYDLCPKEYPRMTHRQEQGPACGNLWQMCSDSKHTRRPGGRRRREWRQKEQTGVRGLRSPLWVGG